MIRHAPPPPNCSQYISIGLQTLVACRHGSIEQPEVRIQISLHTRYCVNNHVLPSQKVGYFGIRLCPSSIFSLALGQNMSHRTIYVDYQRHRFRLAHACIRSHFFFFARPPCSLREPAAACGRLFFCSSTVAVPIARIPGYHRTTSLKVRRHGLPQIHGVDDRLLSTTLVWYHVCLVCSHIDRPPQSSSG